MSIWSAIRNWFSTARDRKLLVDDFNKAAKEAFIIGDVPTLFNATTSRGDSSYRHQFSHFLYSGFRVKVMQGQYLTRDDLVEIGSVFLSDGVLIRKLVVNGFDTLEIFGDMGTIGAKWELKDFIQIGY